MSASVSPMPSRTKSLRLFRHGETDWNVQFRLQGHADIPLNDNGRRQAADLARSLRGVELAAVVSSDLSRAVETARAVCEATGAGLYVDPRLRETKLGEAEGLTVDETIARFGEELWARWRSLDPADLDVSFPGGETKRQALSRSRRAIDEFVLGAPGEAFAACSHGGVMRRLIHVAKPDLPEPASVPNCQVFSFYIDRKSGLWRAEF